MVNPDHSAQSSHSKSNAGMSLHTKGMWLLGLFVVFASFTGFVIHRERRNLSDDTQQVQAVHLAEEAQFGLYMSVARAVLIVNESIVAKDIDTASRRIAIEIDAVLSGLNGLVHAHPNIASHITVLQKSLNELNDSPTQATIIQVREKLHKLIIDLSDISALHRKEEGYWISQYNTTFERLSLEWTLFAVFGIVALGSLIMIFITRLAWDIRRVQDRALQIVEGYRGAPLAVTRNDELGSLMEGINRMQLELRQREIQMEMSRQQQFHKEKMAAVGSLAAAVAHEINNPMSAIVGLSQGMADIKNAKICNGGDGSCQPEALVTQARRVMEITRQIFEFSAPPSAEPKLLDLNSLISSTVKFVSFDRRFRSIDLVLALDPQLPAVHAVGDHITQVLMNLLINAADAAEGRTEPRTRIQLSSHADGDHAVITVADNGPGMQPAILARVFEEFFTTKPPGKGTGIGLAVSKSLIEAAGGTIEIASEPGAGTTVTIKLPLNVPDIDNIKENPYARTGSR